MEHQSLFSFSNPEFWVLVALVLFFGLLVVFKVLPGALFGALDAHAAKIKAELDEAQQLRRRKCEVEKGVRRRELIARHQCRDRGALGRHKELTNRAEEKRRQVLALVGRQCAAESWAER